MIGRSLRWRLLAGAAVAMLVALAAAWIFMVVVFERHLERRLQADMERDGVRLAAALVIGADGAPQIPTLPGDPRLQTPASGYYWQVSNQAGVVRSRSLWDSDLTTAIAAQGDAWRLRRASGPFEPSVALVERLIEPDRGRPPVLIQLAQDTASLADARDEFGREMAVFLLVLWLVLSAAAWLQVQLGLAPLAHIRGEIAALQSNASARLDDRRPTEILPLTEAINTLASAREHDLQQARRRAADLAHGLKTPLAALRAHLRRARDGEGALGDAGFERALLAMERAIEAELARVRVSVIRAAPAGAAKARPVIESLIEVLEHTDRGEQLVFTVEAPDDLATPLSPESLAELLGSVLDNAMRFARRQVRVSGGVDAGAVYLLVEDDGPGIPEADRREALRRGARLDESAGGAGLGLAIAKELAESSGGTLELSSAALGGLGVRFAWRARA